MSINAITSSQNSIDIFPSVGVSNFLGRKISPILKTWEIIICTITVIGLLILLGIYWGRKTAYENLEKIEKPESPKKMTIAPIEIPKVISLSDDEIQQLEKQKEEILNDNPNWRVVVKDWTNISLSDQVWMLQVFELRKLKIPLPVFETIAPSDPLQELLQKRNIIESALLGVSKAFLMDQGLKKLPKAIELLNNLEHLGLSHNCLKEFPVLNKLQKLKTLILNDNELTQVSLSPHPNLQALSIGKNKLATPPDFSTNVNLEILCLNDNPMMDPPDLSKNGKLRELLFFNNKLKKPPDLTQNTLLQTLHLGKNNLSIPPELSKNGDLRKLYLYYNPFTQSPDLSLNPHLEELDLTNTQLKIAPDISKNINLRKISLRNNQLTKAPNFSTNSKLVEIDLGVNEIADAPDLSQNPELEKLYLMENQLTSIPDLSMNKKLMEFSIQSNPLKISAENNLKALKASRPHMEINAIILE